MGERQSEDPVRGKCFFGAGLHSRPVVKVREPSGFLRRADTVKFRNRQ